MIPETKRLSMREMTQEDFPLLCKYLQDADVMYAYERTFTDTEVHEWLDKQIKRYADYGFGAWAVILKETGEMIGQCGITMQDIDDGKQVLEVGYLFQKAHWHKGYATEAAVACRDYAFNELKADALYSIIRDDNLASRHVAERNGMTVCGSFIKHYYGISMPHVIYEIKREK